MTFSRKRKDVNYELEPSQKVVMRKGKSQICAWVDSIQYKKLKVMAASKDTTITEILASYINTYIEKYGNL